MRGLSVLFALALTFNACAPAPISASPTAMASPRSEASASPAPVALAGIYLGTPVADGVFASDVVGAWDRAAEQVLIHTRTENAQSGEYNKNRAVKSELFKVPGSEKPAVRMTITALPVEIFKGIALHKRAIFLALREASKLGDSFHSLQVVVAILPVEGSTDKFGNPDTAATPIYTPIYLSGTIAKIKFDSWDKTHAFEIADEPNRLPGLNYDNDSADIKG